MYMRVPTLHPQSMLVNVVMRLENTYGRLLDDAADDFQSVTGSGNTDW